jgi:hypothetical protein
VKIVSACLQEGGGHFLHLMQSQRVEHNFGIFKNNKNKICGVQHLISPDTLHSLEDSRNKSRCQQMH